MDWIRPKKKKGKREEMLSWFPANGSGLLSLTQHMGRQGEIKWKSFYPEDPILSYTEHQFTHNKPQGQHFCVCVCAF